MRRHVAPDYTYDRHRPHPIPHPAPAPHTYYNPRPSEPPIRHAEVHEYYDIPADGGGGGGGGGGMDHDWQLKHTIEQLRGDLDEKARQNQLLHEKSEEMRQELIRYQDQVRGTESHRARELSDLHDQLQRERKTSSEHHTAACDAIRELQSFQSNDMMHADKLREMSEHIDHLNKNHELERRRWDTEVESLRRQHSRDMEQARGDIQKRLDGEHREVMSRNDTIAKLNKDLLAAQDQLQLVVKQLDSERVVFAAEEAARRAETSRKEEIQKMFEKESGLKQKRVEEAHGVVRELTKTSSEKEQEIAKLQTDLSHRQKLLDDTSKSLKQAEEHAKEMTERADKMAAEYREIANLFGCRELLSSTFLASRHIHEAIQEHEKTKHEITKLKTAATESKNTITSLEGQVAALGKERDSLKKVVCVKDEQLTRSREDLLIATRELRGLMIANEHVLQDKLRAEKTIGSLEKSMKKKDEAIEAFETGKAETAEVEIQAVRAWEKERAVLEEQLCEMKAAFDAKADCEMHEMDKKCSALEDTVRDCNEWVDMCKELYEKVFAIGGKACGKKMKVNDPKSVNDLYCEIVQLKQAHAQLAVDFDSLEVDKARLERLQAAAGDRLSCSRCASQSSGRAADRVFDQIDQNGDGIVTRKEMRHFVDDAGALNASAAVDKLVGAAAAGSGADISDSKADYLKAELRRSTQAMATSKRKFDDFKEAVAKALKFGKKARKVDTTTVLTRIHNLVSRAVAPLDGRFDDCLAHPCKSAARPKFGAAARGRKPCQAEPKLVKKMEHVQKKLLSALQTIEAQDMWISVLQAAGDDDRDLVLSRENHELRGQLDAVRHHLLLETQVGELVDPTGVVDPLRTRRRHPAL